MMIDTTTTLRGMTQMAGLMGGQSGQPGAMPGMEGDPFAMLLGQLMTGQQSDLSLLMKGELPDSRWPDQDAEQLNRAAAMLAEMLAAGSPATAALLQQSLATQTEATTGATGATDPLAAQTATMDQLMGGLATSPAQLLTNLWSQAQSGQTAAADPQWSAALAATQAEVNPQQAQQQAIPTPQTMAAQASTFTAQMQPNVPLQGTPVSADEVLLDLRQTAAKSDPTSPEDLLMSGRSRFTSTVQAAQRLLDATPQKQELPAEAIPDVESLQKAVDSGMYAAKTTASADPEAVPEREELMRQVTTGLSQSLTRGEKEEFVLRLKPEGLGEITVRMTEQQGKIALSISASNAQVAKLLGQELNTLQQSLRPFNAEVQTIVAPQPGQNPDATLYNGMSQNFSQQQQQAFEQQSRSRDGRRQQQSETLPTPAAAVNTASTSALDTYI